MISRSDIPKAQFISNQLDDIQRALDLLAAGAVCSGLIIRSADKEIFAYATVATSTAQTLLTTQKAALTAVLKTLGYA